MRILQLCNKVPYPAKDGYSMAVLSISQSLKDLGHSVQILAMNTFKHKVKEKIITSAPVKVKAININNKINPINAFLCLLLKKSYNIERFISKNYNSNLIAILKKNKFDIIQLEGLYLTHYIKTIRNYSSGKIILRSHNIEYKIWEDLTKNEPFFLKRFYLNILAKQLKKYELKFIDSYDGIISISDNDKKTYINNKCKIKLTSIPISIKKTKQQTDFIKHNSVFFIGSLDWKPNIEGLKWFLHSVWPLVIKKKPKAIFYVAGRNTPNWLKKSRYKNVKIQGEVENAYTFIQSKEIMVSPLFSGSGIRIKLLESMAYKKPIVSTTKSASGINIKDKQDILLADTPNKFAESILVYLSNKDFKKSIIENASNLIKKDYSPNVIRKKIRIFYKSLV